MAAEAAALLDELMGGSRNSMPGENSHQQSWKDDNVCKYFLCGFCPSQLFVNTKADVGESGKPSTDRQNSLFACCTNV